MREYTTEEILAKCPETIDSSTIPVVPTGGQLFHKSGKTDYGGGSRKRKWFNETTRIKAACVYAISGNAARTSEIIGVPSATIRKWKTMPWWNQVIDRIRQEHDDELDIQLTETIGKSIKQVNDRLEHGDYFYDPKEQKLVRKKMSGRDSAMVGAMMIDKRALIRDKRKQHVEETEVMDRLKKLASEFSGFIKAKDVTKESLKQDIVDIDIVEEEEDNDEPSQSDLMMSEILDKND